MTSYFFILAQKYVSMVYSPNDKIKVKTFNGFVPDSEKEVTVEEFIRPENSKYSYKSMVAN